MTNSNRWPRLAGDEDDGVETVEALAATVVRIAREFDADAILTFTETGKIYHLIRELTSSGKPNVIAATLNPRTDRQLAERGVAGGLKNRVHVGMLENLDHILGRADVQVPNVREGHAAREGEGLAKPRLEGCQMQLRLKDVREGEAPSSQTGEGNMTMARGNPNAGGQGLYLVLGCGDVGFAVASRLKCCCAEVAVIERDASKVEALKHFIRACYCYSLYKVSGPSGIVIGCHSNFLHWNSSHN